MPQLQNSHRSIFEEFYENSCEYFLMVRNELDSFKTPPKKVLSYVPRLKIFLEKLFLSIKDAKKKIPRIQHFKLVIFIHQAYFFLKFGQIFCQPHWRIYGFNTESIFYKTFSKKMQKICLSPKTSQCELRENLGKFLISFFRKPLINDKI